MERKESNLLPIISIIVLVIDIIFLVGLTLYSTFRGNSFLQIYKEFKVTIPGITKIALYFGPYIFIVGILILIAKERLLKQKIITLIINVVVSFIILVIALFYFLTISMPITNLGGMVTTPSDEEELFDKGVNYLEKGAYDEAIIEFSKVIERNPTLGAAYAYRGFGYAKKGELEQAISDYNKAIEINPNYAAAYNNRAIVFFDKQIYDKAWEDVHKAKALGYEVNIEFLEELKKTSGRSE